MTHPLVKDLRLEGDCSWSRPLWGTLVERSKRPSPYLNSGDGVLPSRHEMGSTAGSMGSGLHRMGGEHHDADRRPIADGVTSWRHHHVERASVTTRQAFPARERPPAGGSGL